MLSRQLTAGDVCTRTVVVAYPSLAVDEAARVMKDEHVGCLVVIEEVVAGSRKVVGMLTDRDIAMGVVAAQKEPYGLRVGDLMSREVISAREDDPLLDVLAAMRRKAVRRLPVVGAHDILVGLIAIDDILSILAEQMNAVAQAASASNRHEELQ